MRSYNQRSAVQCDGAIGICTAQTAILESAQHRQQFWNLHSAWPQLATVSFQLEEYNEVSNLGMNTYQYRICSVK